MKMVREMQYSKIKSHLNSINDMFEESQKKLNSHMQETLKWCKETMDNLKSELEKEKKTRTRNGNSTRARATKQTRNNVKLEVTSSNTEMNSNDNNISMRTRSALRAIRASELINGTNKRLHNQKKNEINVFKTESVDENFKKPVDRTRKRKKKCSEQISSAIIEKQMVAEELRLFNSSALAHSSPKRIVSTIESKTFVLTPEPIRPVEYSERASCRDSESRPVKLEASILNDFVKNSNDSMSNQSTESVNCKTQVINPRISHKRNPLASNEDSRNGEMLEDSATRILNPTDVVLMDGAELSHISVVDANLRDMDVSNNAESFVNGVCGSDSVLANSQKCSTPIQKISSRKRSNSGPLNMEKTTKTYIAAAPETDEARPRPSNINRSPTPLAKRTKSKTVEVLTSPVKANDDGLSGGRCTLSGKDTSRTNKIAVDSLKSSTAIKRVSSRKRSNSGPLNTEKTVKTCIVDAPETNEAHPTQSDTKESPVPLARQTRSKTREAAEKKSGLTTIARKSLKKAKMNLLQQAKLKQLQMPISRAVQNGDIIILPVSVKKECSEQMQKSPMPSKDVAVIGSHNKRLPYLKDYAMSTGKGKYLNLCGAKDKPNMFITPAKGELLIKVSTNTRKEEEDMEKVLKLKALKEKEEEALVKREKALKSRQDELKRKNEMKLMSAMKQREKLEQEKYKNAKQSEKEKEAKRKMLLKEREIKMKEKILQKKIMNEQKLAETEERRRLEEEARSAKLKEQEAEQQRLMLEKQKELERHEKRAQERMAEEKAREKYEIKLKEEMMKMAKMQSASKAPKSNVARFVKKTYKSRNENDYGLEDENSKLESDDEEQPVKSGRSVPLWAKRIMSRKAHSTQFISFEMMNEYMPCLQKSPNIEKMFKMTPTKRIKRTSSAIWNTPSS